MSQADFAELIIGLTKYLDIPEAKDLEEDYFGLIVDDNDIHIQYIADGDHVVLFTRLQEIEPEYMLLVYPLLLSANIFWQGTAGSTFSADLETGRIFLADKFDLNNLTPEKFADQIEKFVDILGYWLSKIEAIQNGEIEDQSEFGQELDLASPELGNNLA